MRIFDVAITSPFPFASTTIPAAGPSPWIRTVSLSSPLSVAPSGRLPTNVRS